MISNEYVDKHELSTVHNLSMTLVSMQTVIVRSWGHINMYIT